MAAPAILVGNGISDLLVLELKSVCVVSLPDKVSIKGQTSVMLLFETPDSWGYGNMFGRGVSWEEAHAV